MPPKSKKQRASLKLDETSGEVKETDVPVEQPVRQVVEVVEENELPEAIETIKKDTEEIEEAVETIEEEVNEHEKEHHEVVEEPPKGNVESLFVTSDPGVNPEITVVGKKTTPLGVWVGAMLGLALAIGVSLVVLVKGPPVLPFVGAKPTPTLAPTAVPSPTLASLNRADIKISVINGGGTPGAGGKMKTFLEDKGYTVVSVGNAEAYSYEQTEVLAKTGKADIVALMTEDLKADYSLGTSSATVEDTVGFDAQVIVGKEE